LVKGVVAQEGGEHEEWREKGDKRERRSSFKPIPWLSNIKVMINKPPKSKYHPQAIFPPKTSPTSQIEGQKASL